MLGKIEFFYATTLRSRTKDDDNSCKKYNEKMDEKNLVEPLLGGKES